MQTTVSLAPQADGFWQNWSTVFGANDAYLAVDDSTGTTHDGDATYIESNTVQGAAPLVPRVSFQFFDSALGIVPASITLRLAMATGGSHGGSTAVKIGFTTTSTAAFDPTLATSNVSTYALFTRTFAVNPFTGLPWAVDDLAALQPCWETDVSASRVARVTLFNLDLTYQGTTQWMPPYGVSYP